ncbi:MAG: hypothetical protein K6F09_08985 [Clostridiales bacterium]|nr:hypothetical protein [Clostridiales bacterium]
MNKKRMICLALSLAAVVSMFFVQNTAAWFRTEAGIEYGYNIKVDKMYYDIDGSLGEFLYSNGDSFMLAGQNLIVDNDGKITGVNHSTIATNFRVKIEYQTYVQNGNTVTLTNNTYAGAAGEQLSVTFGRKVGTTDSLFTYDQTTGFWNFNGIDYNNDNVFPGTESPRSFDIITNIKYDGANPNVTPEIYKGRSTEVKVTIQAKQALHVNWTTIATLISG